MRVAIVGGGVSGLTAAYELEKARKAGEDLDWQLFEAGDRLGGIVETDRAQGFVLEGGPDAWVSEKPAARALAIELGLEHELIYSQDAQRKTHILRSGELHAVPDRMRMMVPEDLQALEGSDLFSAEARRAYAAESVRADELKQAAPAHDESVASFVERHFGTEVLESIAAPLLSGVFGGDVYKLSVRAVMAPFVAMERQYGSLIVGLQEKAKARGDKAAVPIFTSLRSGMGSLTDAMVATLPAERIRLRTRMEDVPNDFDRVLWATSLDGLRRVLPECDALLPTEASSAVLAAFGWSEPFVMPPGFGFLVQAGETSELLACTFVDQKFANRVPEGGRAIRAFFGGAKAESMMAASDDEIAAQALAELRKVLGNLPQPTVTHVARWQRSLPQYAVGHLDRMDALDELLKRTPKLRVLGNALRGVGLPDLVAQAQRCVRTLRE
jgi:oxygen-dependent protoporphyrinogen oxidase